MHSCIGGDESPRPDDTPAPFVRRFIRSSLVWLGVGVLIGVVMALKPAAAAFRTAHMHANLLGFGPGRPSRRTKTPPPCSCTSITGSGRFVGEGADAMLRAGESAVHRPGETHSVEALDEPLVFHAVLAPRPG
ncbi:MAG TPA: hypothetical protein VF006_16050 [Longimicrobium sp.]